MAQITLNEGLAWLKTLKKRHEELIALRNENAHRERRFYGTSADRELLKEPVYDVKALDKAVTCVAREIRLLEQAMKATNEDARRRLRPGRCGVGRADVAGAQRIIVGKLQGSARSSGRKPMSVPGSLQPSLKRTPCESLLVGCWSCGGAASAEAVWSPCVLSHPTADLGFPSRRQHDEHVSLTTSHLPVVRERHYHA